MARKIKESPAAHAHVKERLREPENFSVILHNDDYTTKEFVVAVLKDIFKKTEEDAVTLMETIHRTGRAAAGVYCFDIASTKLMQVARCARANGFPLKCTLEKV